MSNVKTDIKVNTNSVYSTSNAAMVERSINKVTTETMDIESSDESIFNGSNAAMVSGNHNYTIQKEVEDESIEEEIETPQKMEIVIEEEIKLNPGDSGTIDSDKIDYSHIAKSASDALNGNFIDTGNVLTEYWGDIDDLTYTVRDDGTVLISENGIALGFTTVESLNIKTTKEKNMTVNVSGSITSNDIDLSMLSGSIEDAKNGKYIPSAVINTDTFSGDLTYDINEDGIITISKDGEAVGYTTINGINLNSIKSSLNEELDYTKIATTKNNAQDGTFIPSGTINYDTFTGNLSYEDNGDGTISIIKDGETIGYTTADGIKTEVEDTNNQEKTTSAENKQPKETNDNKSSSSTSSDTASNISASSTSSGNYGMGAQTATTNNNTKNETTAADSQTTELKETPSTNEQPMSAYEQSVRNRMDSINNVGSVGVVGKENIHKSKLANSPEDVRNGNYNYDSEIFDKVDTVLNYEVIDDDMVVVYDNDGTTVGYANINALYGGRKGEYYE